VKFTNHMAGILLLIVSIYCRTISDYLGRLSERTATLMLAYGSMLRRANKSISEFHRDLVYDEFKRLCFTACKVSFGFLTIEDIYNIYKDKYNKKCEDKYNKRSK